MVAGTLRAALIPIRPVFFDELFTRWISGLPLRSIFAALEHDSGPPLYYILVRLLGGGHADVPAIRVMSLFVSLLVFAAVVVAVKPWPLRLPAMAILALLPLHVLFSGDARSYALLATCVGLGCSFLRRWLDEPSWYWCLASAASLIAAVYTHWYGFLFLPLIPLIVILNWRRSGRARLMQGGLITLLIGLAVLPALSLISRQPPEAAEWMRQGDAGSPLLVLAQLPRQLGPAQPFHPALAPPVAEPVVVVSALLVVAVVLAGCFRSAEARLWAAIIATPVAAMIILVIVGRPAYFPGRFESSLALPLALLAASAMASMPRRIGYVLLAIWLALSSVVLVRWNSGYPLQLEDPWRLVAAYAGEAVPAQQMIAASGPMYLELVSSVGDGGARVVALPGEQARHPGWRARPGSAELTREVSGLPRGVSWWAGEVGSREAQALSRRFDLRVEFRAGPVILARLEPRPSEGGR